MADVFPELTPFRRAAEPHNPLPQHPVQGRHRLESPPTLPSTPEMSAPQPKQTLQGQDVRKRTATGDPGSSGDQQPFKVKAEEFEEGELPRATGVVVAAPIQQHPSSLEALTKAWGTAQQVSTAAQRETSVQLAALTAAAAAQKSDIATLGAKLDALAAAHPAPQAAPPGPQLQEVLDALNDVRAAQQASDAKLASFEQQVTAVLTEQFASVTAALNAVRATLARPGPQLSPETALFLAKVVDYLRTRDPQSDTLSGLGKAVGGTPHGISSLTRFLKRWPQLFDLDVATQNVTLRTANPANAVQG